MKKLRRTRLLVKPLLQLKLALVFLSAAVVTSIVQAILLVYTLSAVAGRLPNDEELLRGELPGIVMPNLTVGLLLLVPLTILVGVLATFRFAGPLHHFEGFLRRVADGRQSEPCTLREGDELRSLCDLINEVTEPLRVGTDWTALQESGEPEVVALPSPVGFWGELDDIPSLVDARPASEEAPTGPEPPPPRV